MVLGWRDVVQGPFEVQRKDGPALVVEGLVDDLTFGSDRAWVRPCSSRCRAARSSLPGWWRSALVWEHQRADRARFAEFFGADLLVVPGEQVQKRLDD